jgi:hypothetical protein
MVFAPKKTEIIHITRTKNTEIPSFTFGGGTIDPITTAPAGGRVIFKTPGLKWLEYWFDRRNSGRKYVNERAYKANGVAKYIRNFGEIKFGPPAASLRKIAVTCILSSATYAAKA